MMDRRKFVKGAGLLTALSAFDSPLLNASSLLGKKKIRIVNSACVY